MEFFLNLLVAHLVLSAPLVTEKKFVSNFFLKKMFKIWYVIWPKVWNIFSKFHHTYKDEQSPRHEQGLIGLIG